MLTYVIVGSGYRSEYYGRIAAAHPELFQAIFLCRSEEKVRLVSAHTGIRATTDPQEALSLRPDFAVIAVDRAHIAGVAGEWIRRALPVVVETPAGASMEELRQLWELQEQQGARIVCCEQYHRYPLLADGIAQIRAGLIGAPASAYVSLLHDYHAASLLRRVLLSKGETYVMRGERTAAPVAETDSRYGAFYDGHTAQETRDIMHLSFASGKTAVYDFASVEYRSFIRSRHLVVRGERGEWNDRLLYCLNEENCPERRELMPRIPEKYRCLDTQTLRDGRRTWQGELQLDTAQDEYAIATILLDIADYLAGGPSPYPLEEALEDALFWLMLQDAAAHPWQEIRRPEMPWHGRLWS